jgi:ATP-dependent Clp protease adaptor protein ClpS
MGKKKTSEQVEGGVAVEERTATAKQYKVIMLNDDYTPMDFVVSVLESIFMLSPAESTQVMLRVHRQGRALCGIYTKQIAEAKIALTHQKAKAAGHPLRCIMEEE